ncbi:alpha/beta fold hydrolase [Ornithinimicrobium sufpigmenti]|uniref:alpha/beta fold hydrolase n=1 Tax=Ornithinimicrobium sufpigmenti TaxID=2508882 RepID=UPI001035DAC0|nr:MULTISPECIES: alpha/beta fold hydrolase [unclassified Ornithinimicrobium]
MTGAPLGETRIGDSGPWVVFCHGLFGRGKNFTSAAKALQPDFRSLLLDMPDHGTSPWTERFDYGHAAQLVADHLRAGVAADGPVHVVGHSMGGKIAMTLALIAPELVDRLVVVDITPTGSSGVSEFAHYLDSLARIDLDALRSHGDADRALAHDVPQPSLRGFLLQNLRRDRETKAFAWQPNLHLLRRDLDAITGDIPDDGRTFEGPVLWMAGGRSDYVTDEHGPVMRQLFPKAVQVTIKDAGHWVHSEQPDAFVATLRYFLQHAG